jgi:hypothetical protein
VTYDDGWTHHFLYIVILAYLLHNNMTPLFAVALVEELPIILISFFEAGRLTFWLGVSTICGICWVYWVLPMTKLAQVELRCGRAEAPGAHHLLICH